MKKWIKKISILNALVTTPMLGMCISTQMANSLHTNAEPKKYIINVGMNYLSPIENGTFSDYKKTKRVLINLPLGINFNNYSWISVQEVAILSNWSSDNDISEKFDSGFKHSEAIGKSGSNSRYHELINRAFLACQDTEITTIINLFNYGNRQVLHLTFEIEVSSINATHAVHGGLFCPMVIFSK